MLIAQDAAPPVHRNLHFLGKPQVCVSSVEYDLLELNFGRLLLQSNVGKRIEESSVKTKDVKRVGIYPCNSLGKDQSAAFVSDKARNHFGGLRLLCKGDHMCFMVIEYLLAKVSEFSATSIEGMKN